MTIRDLFEDESELPKAISDALQAISKNEDGLENSITSTPVYQETRANFIASVRRKRISKRPPISVVQLQTLISRLKATEE